MKVAHTRNAPRTASGWMAVPRNAAENQRDVPKSKVGSVGGKECRAVWCLRRAIFLEGSEAAPARFWKVVERFSENQGCFLPTSGADLKSGGGQGTKKQSKYHCSFSHQPEFFSPDN